MKRFLFIIFIQILVVAGQEPKDSKDQCGQKEFYDPSGTIQSPDYPGNYPDDSNCVYRILTDRIINVTFNNFALEQSEECKYDYLQFVFQANRVNATPQRYCGDGLSKVNGGTLRGQGPLIVGFKSDESDNLKGFRFTYEFELNGPDPCLSDPCQNEGNCSAFPGYYTCECTDGYAGVNCEIDKDECLSYPCQHNGECADGLNSFTCECANGFTGELCEIKPDLCSSNPCLNGGLCVERYVDYVCSCPRDFIGDHCEAPVPTPPPPITTAPPTTEPTTPPEETSDDPLVENPDDNNEDPEDQLNPPNDPATNSSASEPPLPPTNIEPLDPDDNTTLIVIIAVVTSIVVLALIGIGWCWWKTKRSVDGVKPIKEVTLINMKTKSQKGKGKNGRRLSRTTSFNSVTMKGDANNNKFINQLQKVSEDIIMEEVTDDSVSSVTKPLAVIGGNQPPIHVDDSIVPANASQLKRISIPVTKNELQAITGDRADDGLHRRATQVEPLCISPEDAVNLLNKMKQNQGADRRSALELYGMSSLPKHQLTNVATGGNFHFDHILSDDDGSLQLPNVPIPTNFAPKKTNGHWIPRIGDHADMMELSPEEAAEVVNHFLKSEPMRRKNIDTKEAMDIIQEIKSKRGIGDKPTFDRQKSVVVHPQQVANLINNFPHAKHTAGMSMDRNPDSVMSSTYAPSEVGERHQPYRMHRDFREYSPIQEEESEEGATKPLENTQKRPSQDFGNALDEPELKRLRKKSKRFPYARTLDPDEKVHDWLKNTSKEKDKHRDPISPSEANATQTIITRPLPAFNQQNETTNKIQNKSVARDDDDVTPRTIRQTRRFLRESKSSITVTENKAKSLVEKLMKAPARSSQNVVGPGLGVSRENAFVEESF